MAMSLQLIKIFFGMTLGLVLSVILTFSVRAEDGSSRISVINLSEAIPDADRDSFPANLHVLPGGRLFVVSDRLTLYDLATLEETASIPIPVPYAGKFDYSVMDRVQALNDGFVWITERPNGSGFADFFYYEFDDSLAVREETVLNGRFPPEIGGLIPDYRSLEIVPDGSAWYYFGLADVPGLYRYHLESDKNSVILRTDPIFDDELRSIVSVRIVNDGKTVLLKAGRSSEIFTGIPEGVLATVDLNGKKLRILEPESIAYSFVLTSMSYLGAIPQTSPVVLAIPENPPPADPNTFQLPPTKTIYAWNVETDEISAIPLGFPGEDVRVRLSSGGKYLASVGSEDPYGENHTVFIRVYNVSAGEILLNYELAEVNGYAKILDIDEKTRIVAAAYRQAGAIWLIRISF